MADYPPTPEQQDFLDAIDTGRSILVQAGAGAGKTTTCRKGADKLGSQGKRGLYTAFNSAIVKSAAGSFPRNVRCQPPGTLVTVVASSHRGDRWGGPGRSTGWAQVPIEELQAGDRVVTWHGPRLGRIRKTGREVTSVASRQYDGDLIRVTTPGGATSAYTADHICMAMIPSELPEGDHVVYLMRRDRDYRVGRTPWRLGKQGAYLGPVHRAKVQGADALWILSVHKTAAAAALAEALAQHRYGIPGWQFRSANQLMPLTAFWAEVGNNAERAGQCLVAHGRDIRFPFWAPGRGHWMSRPVEIRACNLVTGMTVCEADRAVAFPPDRTLQTGGWTDAWQPATVTRESYAGPVYSLDVDTDHTYIADGIVTHNCATTYSIAFRAGGHAWADRLDIKGQTLRDVARIVGITSPLMLGPDRQPLAPHKVARLAIGTVEKFCASADDELGAAHVPAVPGCEDAAEHIAGEVLPFALRAWADMSKPRTGQLRVKPGLYFKRWALSRPQFEADFLMVDEVQDTDPVLARVLQDQTLPMYLIGDDAQRIYGWRGCVSVMGDFPDAVQLNLTKSFRFGPAIAAEANKWLELLDAKIRLTGHEPVGSRIGKLDRPDAVLTRSNAEAVLEAIEAHKQGVKVHLKGAGDDVRALAEAASQLQQGKETWHPELQAFRSWHDVTQYVDDGMASTELENTVRLLDTHGIETVLEGIGGCVAEPYAERVVTTTHKVKGLEWDSVRIADDWHPPKDRGTPVREEMAMLAYVAVTRAKGQLDRGGLAWVDQWAGETIGRGQVPAPTPGPEVAAVEPAEPRRRVGVGPGTARALEALRAAQVRAAQPGYSEDDRIKDAEAIVAAYLDQGVRPHLTVVGA